MVRAHTPHCLPDVGGIHTCLEGRLKRETPSHFYSGKGLTVRPVSDDFGWADLRPQAWRRAWERRPDVNRNRRADDV